MGLILKNLWFCLILLMLGQLSAQSGKMKVTSEGALVPQGQHQNVMAPENGLLMYDTVTTTFWYYKNNVWKEIGNDDDINPTNELQNISASLLGDTMYLSNGGYLIVPGISAANHQVVDGDLNEYTPIQIGNQVWLKQNLRSTKYNDGTPIQKGDNSEVWDDWNNNGDHSGLYCWYNNDSITYASVSGALYNYGVIDQSLNGDKNICPIGFRVPTSTDFQTLRAFMGNPAYQTYLNNLKVEGCDNDVMVLDAWQCGTYVGNDSFGMSVKPAGRRDGFGTFYLFKSISGIWRNDGLGNSVPQFFSPENFTIDFGYDFGGDGCSIRCIKE